MKALCICASPRHNGSCSFILDCFINGFISEENTAEKVCILMWIYSIAAVAKNVMKTESVFKRTVF